MTASRRLQLAAETSGGIGIAIRRWRRQSEAADFGQPTASITRWRVSSLPSAPLPTSGVGRARWLLELIRCRAGESADFIVEACDAKGSMVNSRAYQPFVSIDDLWRRASIPASALALLAEADAFRQALGLARREALWAIKALRDEPLPLFAAASRVNEIIPEIDEPKVALRPMTAGREVVEDYSHVGLTLRTHPMAFLRNDLQQRKIVTCHEAMNHFRDGLRVEVAGLVLVRQRPGSAKGVMFITLEDETGIANLVLWPQIFEQFRTAVLGATMMAVRGLVQREGEVVHIVARQITDLSRELSTIGGREDAFPLTHGRGDEFRHGAVSHSPDSRDRPKGPRVRDIYIPDLHIDTIKVKARNFQ